MDFLITFKMLNGAQKCYILLHLSSKKKILSGNNSGRR